MLQFSSGLTSHLDNPRHVRRCLKRHWWLVFLRNRTPTTPPPPPPPKSGGPIGLPVSQPQKQFPKLKQHTHTSCSLGGVAAPAAFAAAAAGSAGPLARQERGPHPHPEPPGDAGSPEGNLEDLGAQRMGSMWVSSFCPCPTPPKIRGYKGRVSWGPPICLSVWFVRDRFFGCGDVLLSLLLCVCACVYQNMY